MQTKTKFICTILVLIVGIAAAISFQHRETTPKSDGAITFILIDEEGNEAINQELVFYEGETLFDILNREYEVVCANELYKRDESCSYKSPYGYAVLEINHVTSDWYNSFLAIYINDQYANYGVSYLEYKDQDEIKLMWTSLE